MLRSRTRTAELVTLVLSVLVLLSIFVPWVETGVLEEVDTINGIDIPVLGWSSVIVTLIAIALAVGGFVTRNRWLWCAQLFVVGFMLTGATSVLMTLDVMDSAVVGWITRVLPEDMQDASPQMQATFSMWVSYSLTLFAAAAGCLVVIWRSNGEHDDEDDQVWGNNETFVLPSTTPSDSWPPRNPWESPPPPSSDKPSWM